MERTREFERAKNDPLTQRIISAGIEVHRYYGPGLLESEYRRAFGYELANEGLKFVVEPLISAKYKTLPATRAFRADIIVEERVILELKHVEKLLAIHEAQLRTYLRHAQISCGLLFNFNTVVLKNGIRRIDIPLMPWPQVESPTSPNLPRLQPHAVERSGEQD